MGRQDVCEHRVLFLRLHRVLCAVVLLAAWRRSPHVGTRQVAVILVLVIGTVRLIGGNANNAFSTVANELSQ